MPVQKVKGGYRWGTKGKVYKSRAEAAKQGRAIKARKTTHGSTVSAVAKSTPPGPGHGKTVSAAARKKS